MRRIFWSRGDLTPAATGLGSGRLQLMVRYSLPRPFIFPFKGPSGTMRFMDQATHNKIVSFIWGIADDVLRDLFKRGKYPEPMTMPYDDGINH